MYQINVQFSDDKETDIIAYFGSIQTDIANVGVIDPNDARYLAFYNSMPVPEYLPSLIRFCNNKPHKKKTEET